MAIKKFKIQVTQDNEDGTEVSYSIDLSDIQDIINFNNLYISGKPAFIKGIDIQTGNVEFNNEKSRNVIFEYPFIRKPFVDLTLEAGSQVPAFKVNQTLNGFTISFNTKYTGIVGWKATLI